MASQLRLQGASVSEGALSLARWNPVLLQQRVSDLEVTNAGLCLSASLCLYCWTALHSDPFCLIVYR
jgi:hypothetical protein